MWRLRVVCGAGLLALVIGSHTSVAWAEDDREAARGLANRAADAIARGDYQRAEEDLRSAYARYPAPTIALLHARTLMRLQRLAAAHRVYELATLTSLGPDAPEAFVRAVELARQESSQLAPRVPRLQLVVRGGALREPGLELALDGRPVPVAQQGRWMFVDPGRRVVQARLSGRTSEQVVRVDEGQSIVVEVAEPTGERPAYRALTWGSLGLGAAGIATGVVTGLVAVSAHDRAREQCADQRCLEGSAGARQLERFETYRVVSTVGYAVGAVGVVAGGLLLLGSALEGPALTLEVDRGAARVGLGGAL